MRKDFLAGIVFALVGGFLFQQTFTIRKLRFDVLGTRFFPQVACVFLILSALLLIISSAMKKTKDKERTQIKSARPLIFLGIFLGYAVLLSYIGFLLSSFLFVAGSYLTIRRSFRLKDLLYSCVYGLSASFCVWYIFENVLKMLLP